MAYIEKNLSAKTIAEITPSADGQRIYYKDAKEPGLVLCCMPSGTMSFQVYIKIKRAPVRVTLGRYNPSIADSVELPRGCTHNEFLSNTPELNVRMARALAALVKIDLKAGINPADIKRANRAELTLGELLALYIERHLAPHAKASGAKQAKSDFELYLGDLPNTPRLKKGRARKKSLGSVKWERRLISGITRSEIQKLHVDLGRHIGTETANKILKLLRAIFNKAIDWGFLKKDNPTDGIPKFKSKSRDRFLQPDELPRFFLSLSQEDNTDVRDCLLLSLLTGARKSNVVAMAWDEVNLENGT